LWGAITNSLLPVNCLPKQLRIALFFFTVLKIINESKHGFKNKNKFDKKQIYPIKNPLIKKITMLKKGLKSIYLIINN
jgi:hypothetical protein